MMIWARAVARRLTHCSRCGLPVLPGEPVYEKGGRSRHPCCEEEQETATALGLRWRLPGRPVPTVSDGVQAPTLAWRVRLFFISGELGGTT